VQQYWALTVKKVADKVDIQPKKYPRKLQTNFTAFGVNFIQAKETVNDKRLYDKRSLPALWRYSGTASHQTSSPSSPAPPS
jgi:hypothetical protein